MYINLETNQHPLAERDIRQNNPNVSYPSQFNPGEDDAVVFPSPHPASDASDTPDLITYTKSVGWQIEDGDDRCPRCADRLFTYDDDDVQQLLSKARNPAIARLAKIAIDYANQCGGLTRGDFLAIEEIIS